MNWYQITKTEWYNKKGQLHREDGPAIIYSNGTKRWFINGLRHRDDGPAVETNDGYKEWYINNKQLSENEFNQYLLKHNLNKI